MYNKQAIRVQILAPEKDVALVCKIKITDKDWKSQEFVFTDPMRIEGNFQIQKVYEGKRLELWYYYKGENNLRYISADEYTNGGTPSGHWEDMPMFLLEGIPDTEARRVLFDRT